MTLHIDRVLGNTSDNKFTEVLSVVESGGQIDYLFVDSANVSRRRFRAATQNGEECIVALSGDRRLTDGDIVLLDHGRAVIVRVDSQEWMRVIPADVSTALRLGHLAGHLHWVVRFDAASLLVALEDDPTVYIERLSEYVEAEMCNIELPTVR